MLHRQRQAATRARQQRLLAPHLVPQLAPVAPDLKSRKHPAHSDADAEHYDQAHNLHASISQ